MYTDVIDTRQRHFAVALAIVFLTICQPHVPAMADDVSLCEGASGHKEAASGHKRVESCTRLLDSTLDSGTEADAKKMARLYFWRGYAYAELKQNKKAINDFTSAIEHNPRVHGAYQYRGIVFQTERQFKRSIVDFNIAISLSPTTPEIYFDRGYSWTKLNQFKKAIEDFTKVIEIEADFVSDAYNMRGYAYALSGDDANALSDFKQAIALEPKSANYRHSLGEVLSYSGKHQEALTVWKEACQLATTDDARGWHKSLAKHGYYSGDIDQPCNEKTLKAFEVCAKVKCRF